MENMYRIPPAIEKDVSKHTHSTAIEEEEPKQQVAETSVAAYEAIKDQINDMQREVMRLMNNWLKDNDGKLPTAAQLYEKEYRAYLLRLIKAGISIGIVYEKTGSKYATPEKVLEDTLKPMFTKINTIHPRVRELVYRRFLIRVDNPENKAEGTLLDITDEGYRYIRETNL